MVAQMRRKCKSCHHRAVTQKTLFEKNNLEEVTYREREVILFEAVGMLSSVLRESGGCPAGPTLMSVIPHLAAAAAATIDINNEQIGLGSAGYQIIIMQEVNCIVGAAARSRCVSNLFSLRLSSSSLIASHKI